MDNRQPINLIGGGFRHSPSTSGHEPLFMKWIKDGQTAPVSIYVDQSLKTTPNKNTKNYGWLVESKTINKGLYNWCLNNTKYLSDNFKTVFTHDVSLCEQSDIFTLCQTSGKSFIADSDLYNKNKLVSMVASNKVMCDEHVFRQQMIKKYKDSCDHFGRGFNPIHNKEDALKDYCFSIAIENGTYPNMFSEKLTDCFMTGTIPIYYGMGNIGEFFNMDGIIILNDDFNIDELSFELYESKLNAIKDNLNRAKELLIAEDYLYTKFLKNEI